MQQSRRIFWLSDANTAHTQRWVEALAERGYEILVFSLVEPIEDWSVGIQGVRLESGLFEPEFVYTKEGAWRKLLYVRALPEVRQLAKQFDPKVFHAHYTSSYGLLATLAGFRPRIVSVWGADVYSAPELSKIHRFLVRQVLRRADSLLSTSWTMRERVLQLHNCEIGVVPFGIDINRFAPNPERTRKSDVLTVGTVKTLESKYGIEYLIRGFSLFRKANPEISARLIIVGPGSLLEKLQKLANDLEVAADVNFVGRVSYDKVHEYHQMLDIGVYPSIEDSESFGVSVIESQACGVPVIVSRVGGLTEVISEGETGLVVPPFDSEAIAKGIEELASDMDFRLKMAESGRQRVEENYSLEKTVNLLLTEYKKFGVT